MECRHIAFKTNCTPLAFFFWFQKKKPDREVQRNKDGLIYLTLAFDNTKGIKPPPPKREETEYVSIDLHKTALHPNAINES